MCGIAGLVGLPRHVAEARVAEALRRLAHRGPDGEGVHAEEGAVLGMRRLAIIDLAGGDQPIYNEDRRVAVVCNGELYNYVELLPELAARGHTFQSRSDVNVVAHLYEERGRDAFQPVRGMFAAAVWDARRRRLLLARDRAGKKPLFWARTGAGLAFASELPSLLALLERTPALRREALADYMRLGAVPHPESVYEGVFALPPGCTLSFEPDRDPDVAAYWTPPLPPPYAGGHAELLDELDVRLKEAVALRLRSDVPVGMFLSGGIDSGLVASYAADLGARDLLCFVVEVADPRLNEAPAAEATARRLGLPIERVPLEFAPRDIVETIALLYGQPYADSSAIPSYLVARAAARHRKVVLVGDGGDEIFAGYRRYWAGRIAPWAGALLRNPLGAAAARTAGRLAAGLGRRSAAGFGLRTLRGLALPDAEAYLALSHDLLGVGDVARLFPDLAQTGSTVERLAELRGGERLSCDGLRAFQRSDYRHILVDGLLPKMDMATMANSLEARSPLLDVPLAEFSWSLPEKWMLRAAETKPLLRALARKRLPQDVASAPKRGFEVPVARWLAGDLREVVGDLLLSGGSHVAALGNAAAIRTFVEGKDGFAGNRPQAVWLLLMLEFFLRAPAPERAA